MKRIKNMTKIAKPLIIIRNLFHYNLNYFTVLMFFLPARDGSKIRIYYYIRIYVKGRFCIAVVVSSQRKYFTQEKKIAKILLVCWCHYKKRLFNDGISLNKHDAKHVRNAAFRFIKKFRMQRGVVERLIYKIDVIELFTVKCVGSCGLTEGYFG